MISIHWKNNGVGGTSLHVFGATHNCSLVVMLEMSYNDENSHELSLTKIIIKQKETE